MIGPKPHEDARIISYLTLRKAVGYIGVALPLVLAVGSIVIFHNHGLRKSVSDYYYTGMRDVLVGSLSAIGVFFLAYKGYDLADTWISNLAGFFAIGVALLPTAPDHPSSAHRIIGYIHLTFAGLLFLTLAVISWFLFTKTARGVQRTRHKKMRDKVYRVCAGVIMICLILAIIVHVHAIVGPSILRLKPLFWLESIAVVAFGVSWLVKGQAILKD